MLSILAACAIWLALVIVLGVLIADAGTWVRNHRRDRM